MKRLSLVVFLFASLSVSAYAQKDDGEFPLAVQITAVHMEQGQTDVSGSGSTDSNGNYSSYVGGGGSYTWKLYTAQIVGDSKIYELSTPRMHFKGGLGTAFALGVFTGGLGTLAVSRRNYWLHIGTYHGRWNKNGTLEIQFTDKKGKQTHQTFRIESEEITPTTPAPTAEQIAAKNAQHQACIELAKDNPSVTCK
ncbi:MAG: hypothetical protein ACYDC6_01005 [Acidobacteriaceae bacterium]